MVVLPKSSWWCLVALLLVPTAALTADKPIPVFPSRLVYDESHVLDAPSATKLSDELRDHEKKTSNQIAVAIFRSLDGEVLEPFVNRLFHEWGLGQKAKHNGVLLAVFIKERKVRIEVGYGLEPVLTDAATRRILEEDFRPPAKRNDYGAAALRATQSIVRALDTAGPLSEVAPAHAQPGVYQALKRLDSFHVFFLLVWTIIVLSKLGKSVEGIKKRLKTKKGSVLRRRTQAGLESLSILMFLLAPFVMLLFSTVWFIFLFFVIFFILAFLDPQRRKKNGDSFWSSDSGGSDGGSSDGGSSGGGGDSGGGGSSSDF